MLDICLFKGTLTVFMDFISTFVDEIEKEAEKTFNDYGIAVI